LLLTLETTHAPATDLGFLLGKHPERVQRFDLSFGQAHVFYPLATPQRCQVALLCSPDPIALVRGPGEVEQYVNDRPYVASSFLSVAIARVFGAALGGRSKDRPALAQARMPLTARLPALSCPGGERTLLALFEPLGYEVQVEPLTPDEPALGLGEGRLYGLTLRGHCALQALLSHLYVLLPAMDNHKHYWIGPEEVQKLLQHGGDWLPLHPARAWITRRYLKHQGALTRDALSALDPDDNNDDDAPRDERDVAPNLHQRRLEAVADLLQELGARKILDLGCGEGKLLRLLATREVPPEELVGVDVSPQALTRATARLERLPEHQRRRVRLFQASAVYPDSRLTGFDAICAVEVIEHLDPWRLDHFADALLLHASPQAALITTPNREYNALYPNLKGQLRHRDHRFEWTRAEFENWCLQTAARAGYQVRVQALGEEHPEHGAPTQLGVFTR
jgi:3' terminal RNA ribose 2'-O-methyltransferase Hen1